MSGAMLDGTSFGEYLLTGLPSLLIKNLEKFHLINDVPRY
jgi:hypothetical protein